MRGGDGRGCCGKERGGGGRRGRGRYRKLMEVREVADGRGN